MDAHPARAPEDINVSCVFIVKRGHQLTTLTTWIHPVRFPCGTIHSTAKPLSNSSMRVAQILTENLTSLGMSRVRPSPSYCFVTQWVPWGIYRSHDERSLSHARPTSEVRVMEFPGRHE